MTCPDCGEHLEGDGYAAVLYCPNGNPEAHEYAEPDAGPFYCDNVENDE